MTFSGLAALGRFPLFRAFGRPRSPQWSALRDAFVAANPACACCGGTRSLDVHHVVPFHVDPSRELDWDNLIGLCRAGPARLNCHFLVGHLGDWRAANPCVADDARYFRAMLARRAA